MTVKRDATAPQVACPAAPSFEAGANGSITATVSDGGSGPQADKVTVAAVTTKAGGGSVSVTGRDVAGNATTVTCAFTVAAAKVPAPRAVSITSIATLPPAKACVSRRKFPIRLRGVKASKIVRAQVKLNGKQVRNVTGRALGLPIDLRPSGRFVVAYHRPEPVQRVPRPLHHRRRDREVLDRQAGGVEQRGTVAGAAAAPRRPARRRGP